MLHKGKTESIDLVTVVKETVANPVRMKSVQSAITRACLELAAEKIAPRRLTRRTKRK